MGNLIIKGKGGAGNKLIIQDQAGAAVLTTADSGGANFNIGSSSSFPAGHVIQTVQSLKLDASAMGYSASFGTITGTDQANSGSVFCCKITPTSTLGA